MVGYLVYLDHKDNVKFQTGWGTEILLKIWLTSAQIQQHNYFLGKNYNQNGIQERNINIFILFVYLQASPKGLEKSQSKLHYEHQKINE